MTYLGILLRALVITIPVIYFLIREIIFIKKNYIDQNDDFLSWGNETAPWEVRDFDDENLSTDGKI